jgi:hypothetical protein
MTIIALQALFLYMFHNIWKTTKNRIMWALSCATMKNPNFANAKFEKIEMQKNLLL